MGNNDDELQAANGENLRRLSQGRLIDLFKSKDLSYFIDSDNDFGCFANDMRLYFMVRGEQQEILHGRCDFMVSYALDELAAIRDFIESWHRENVFPRIHYVVTDTGAVKVATEYIVDYEKGVTDAQLMTHLQLLVAVSEEVFTALTNFLRNGA